MDESKVTMKGRLGPGMMITVDLQSGQVCKEFFYVFPKSVSFLLLLLFVSSFGVVLGISLKRILALIYWVGSCLLKWQVYENTEVKKRVALLNPYGKWVKENLRSLKAANFHSATVMDSDAILRHQQ